MQFNALIMWNS